MQKLTLAILRSWSPCYDPIKYFSETWEGTALDILKHHDIPDADKLWACYREGVLSDKILRLAAVKNARKVQHLMTDPRSIKALDVAEAYAHGKATKEELAEAYAASAAASAYAYASAAASAAASAYASAYASAAASAAASAYASAAAASAASAYASAAYYAAYAASAAASAAARKMQVKILVDLIYECEPARKEGCNE